jgi:DNA invertase Pin-like site-specific DNA recombinase
MNFRGCTDCAGPRSLVALFRESQTHPFHNEHFIKPIVDLQERGLRFQSLTEQIDTTTSGGKLIFHVFGALAEFEREIIRERTQAGLAAARARGRQGRWPRVAGLNDPKKLAMAQALYRDKSHSIADICQTLRISRATLYRYLQAGR